MVQKACGSSTATLGIRLIDAYRRNLIDADTFDRLLKQNDGNANAIIYVNSTPLPKKDYKVGDIIAIDEACRWKDSGISLDDLKALINSTDATTNDVIGPNSSVESDIVEFASRDGKVLKDSGIGHYGLANAVSLAHAPLNVTTDVNDPGSDTVVPSEKAVRSLFNSIPGINLMF